MNFRVSPLLISCLLNGLTFAQSAHKPNSTVAAGDRKLISVHVTGTSRYTPEEVIAASGLEIGKAAGNDVFEEATRRLGESGFFSKAAYSYSYSPSGTKLEFQLADAEKLVPAHFENFVWFSDEELLQEIRKHLPLFKGQVPIGGTFCDQVSDVLQALLVQHNLAAHADYFRDSKNNEGPVDAVNFRTTGVELRIADVQFSGAGSEELPALRAAADKLVGKEYVRTEIDSFVTTKLLPVYFERGFLKAVIEDQQAKVVKETEDNTDLAIQLKVTPGADYKISRITWVGNTAIKNDRLQQIIHAKVGETANAQQLHTDLEAVHKLYGRLGYMLASVKAVPEFDDSAAIVAYKLEVQEGDVFHLGELDIQGVDAKTTDRLREAWTLRETDPYDNTYPRRFFEETVKLLSRDVTWTVSIHEGVNEKDKTVDVTLRYGLKPSS